MLVVFAVPTSWLFAGTILCKKESQWKDTNPQDRDVPKYGPQGGPSGNIDDVKEFNRQAQVNNTSKVPPVDGSKRKQEQEQAPKKENKKTSIREQTTFSWRNVGFWDSDTVSDKMEVLKMMKRIEEYVVDHFYGDWYWNTSLAIGTCYFAWLFAKWGWGILSLGLVFTFTTSVYRIEFRRFNRDIRDDMNRINASNRLENELETMEWLNSFLDKFWVIYMPALSEQVMYQANEVLKDQAPGFGIEALSLDEFTLGSKAPRVDSIKSYTMKGQDHIEMDWAFSFTPNDTDDMTKNEIKKKINPKVALGVTIGKAFIKKSLPILVEDMSFTGRMNIKFKLYETFPHLKMVSVQFLEAPVIDYALKPVGGDTLGIDIMSFIPGLASFVNGLIHSNLRPMLYAPNSLDIDVADIMEQQSNDSTGVVAVTIKRCHNLKTGQSTKSNSINPYVELKLLANADVSEKTKIKKLNNDPIFAETKYLLVNSLDGNNLSFNVFDFVKDKKDDTLIGNVDYSLGELLQKEERLGLTKNITEGGKTVGKIEFDLRYFPSAPPATLEDGTKVVDTQAEVGILKLNLHGAKDLDISRSVVGLLNPYAEIYINSELTKSCRRLRQTNEPSWNQSFESMITQQSETQVQVLIKDSADDEIVAKLDASLQDLIFETSRGQQWITCSPLREGGPHSRIKISAGWKPLSITDSSVVDTHFNASIGGLRLHLRGASDLINLESVGKVDPYARVIVDGKLKARTVTIGETTDPVWDTVYFFPVTTQHQHLLIQVMDAETEGKDRNLGSVAVNVNEILKKNEAGYFLGYDGAEEILEQPVLFDGQNKGSLQYSLSFIPTLPLYTISQKEDKAGYQRHLNKIKKEEEEKQKRQENLFKKHPNEYEWVEVAEDNLPEPPKIDMPLEKAIKYRTGSLVVHLLDGKFSDSELYVHTLFDDQAYPSGITSKNEGKTLTAPSTSEGFVRDLPNSKLILRLAKKAEVDDEKDIVAEKIWDTIDVLKSAYHKPIHLRINDRNQLTVRVEFIPSAVKLAPLDTILDVGYMKLDILSAENLQALDSNGKSDPFAAIKLDGVQIFKTDKKRKTLDPSWNEGVEFPMISRSRQVLLLEVYDWDLTHDDRLLGRANMDLSTIEPLTSTQFSVRLDTQGTVHLRATFKPEYIRPKLSSTSPLPIDLGAVAAAPVKIVGGAAGLAGNAVGTGLGLASDGVTKGGMLFKNLGKKKSSENERGGESGQEKQQKEQKQKNEQSNGHDTIDENGEEHDEDSDEADNDEEDADKHSKDENGKPKKKYASEMQDEAPSFDEEKPPSVKAVPNVHAEMLPPPQKPDVGGHGRHDSSHTDMSSVMDTSMQLSFLGESSAGRFTIISAHGFKQSALEVKVIMKTPEKEKTLYKLRLAKGDKQGNFKWSETLPFRAYADGTLVFILREHHRIGRSVEVGRGEVSLEAFQEEHQLAINGGTLHVKVTTSD